MKITKEIKKRIEKAGITYSKLIAVYNFGECLEVQCERWGDLCTYRIYKNGDVVEKWKYKIKAFI